MKPETFRLVKAMFLAPLTLAAVWAVIGLLTGSVIGALLVGLYVFIIAFVCMLVFGLPIHLVLKKSNQSDLSSYLIAGLILTLIPVVVSIISTAASRYSDGTGVIIIAIILVPSGVLTAGMGWKFARPDLEENIDPGLFE